MKKGIKGLYVPSARWRRRNGRLALAHTSRRGPVLITLGMGENGALVVRDGRLGSRLHLGGAMVI